MYAGTSAALATPAEKSTANKPATNKLRMGAPDSFGTDILD
jgi:hypothetical protein